ncbi:hypothetical protein C9374_010527 [Naegleria lovaniensis]|uniref:Myb domain-containing protein n=1 Tax=Naegleria lovaniensis TaxID=51637 RepID=A0AA88GGJ6_NAELO|nr:uncharacterized protein C9374_010527 [Naegleria lovaniensis]KAG2374783.1 hypothetical protein C9374_010527 [Naegleria lovaniensis]
MMEDDEYYHYDDEEEEPLDQQTNTTIQFNHPNIRNDDVNHIPQYSDPNIDAAASPKFKPSFNNHNNSNTNIPSYPLNPNYYYDNNNYHPSTSNNYNDNNNNLMIHSEDAMNEALPSSPSSEDSTTTLKNRMSGEVAPSSSNAFSKSSEEQGQGNSNTHSSSQRNYIDDDDILFENQEKQLQTQKYLTIVPYEIAYHEGQLLTCVRVNRLPILVNKLVEEVNQYLQQERVASNDEENHHHAEEIEDEEKVVDVYAIQTLFLNCIMRIDKFNNESEVYQHVRKRVFDNLQNVMSPPDYYPFNYPTFYGEDHDIEQIESYNKLMESDEMKESRKSYQTKYTAQWTKQERKKFNEGLKLFGYGHDSNKKIAEYMGSHIHPNQVAHEKQRLQLSHQKKRKKTKK